MPIKMPQKELDVLSLLLRSEQPMTISDIVAMNPDYTINMIKPIIRKLSKLEMVEVAGIVYRGTSIARTFKPTKTAHLVLQDIFQQEYQSFRELFTDNSLLISLVKSEFTKNPDCVLNYNAIIVDEAQFASPEQIDLFSDIVDTWQIPPP